MYPRSVEDLQVRKVEGLRFGMQETYTITTGEGRKKSHWRKFVPRPRVMSSPSPCAKHAKPPIPCNIESKIQKERNLARNPLNPVPKQPKI